MLQKMNASRESITRQNQHQKQKSMLNVCLGRVKRAALLLSPKNLLQIKLGHYMDMTGICVKSCRNNVNDSGWIRYINPAKEAAKAGIFYK